MTTLKLLSKKELEARLVSAGEEWPDVAEALRFHISALEAYNAALLGALIGLEDGGNEDDYAHAKTVIRAEHPGTELLEAHKEALADNAVLLDHMRGVRNELDDLAGIRAGGKLRWVVDQPHPGAALLEEISTMRPAWARLRRMAEQQGRSVGGVLDDAEGHRKALVRARNEGLEKAAARARKAAEHQCDPYQFRCTEDWQGRIDGLPDDILALKEPEE